MAEDDAARFCRQQAAPNGSNLYYASLFLKPRQRRLLYAAHAYAGELEQATHSSDPGVTRMRLQWWRGQFTGQVLEHKEHPIITELNFLSREPPPQAQDASWATDWAIAWAIAWATDWERQFSRATLDPIERHRESHGALWSWTAKLCGYQFPETGLWAERLGCSLQCLQRLQHDPRQYAQSLPGEEDLQPRLQRHVQQLQAILQKIEQGFPVPDRAQQSVCLIMARLASETCREIEMEGYQLLRQRTTLTPLRKLWLAWRTQRSEHKITRRGTG